MWKVAISHSVPTFSFFIVDQRGFAVKVFPVNLKHCPVVLSAWVQKNRGKKVGWDFYLFIYLFLTTDKAAHAKQHTTPYLSIFPHKQCSRSAWCVVGCEVMRHLDATPLASHRILHLDAG